MSFIARQPRYSERIKLSVSTHNAIGRSMENPKLLLCVNRFGCRRKKPKIQLRCSDVYSNDNESIMHTHEYIVKYPRNPI